MKIKFTIHPDKKLISSLFKGTIVYEDIVQWCNQIYGHPDFSSEYQGIIDMREVTFGLEDRNQPSKMAEKAKSLAQYMANLDFTTAKWAILADTPIETSLSMMYANDASRKHPINIFSTVEAAENYLDTPLADVIRDMDR